MRVGRRRGRLLLTFGGEESTALTMLFADLQALLESGDTSGDTPGDIPDVTSDPVLTRLYPAGYRDDDNAEAEYAELTRTSLHTLRLERLAACADELGDGDPIDLSEPDAGQRWIAALNDLRLALGVRLGVTDEPAGQSDADDPDSPAMLTYHWLTYVQDKVVEALSR